MFNQDIVQWAFNYYLWAENQCSEQFKWESSSISVKNGVEICSSIELTAAKQQIDAVLELLNTRFKLPEKFFTREIQHEGLHTLSFTGKKFFPKEQACQEEILILKIGYSFPEVFYSICNYIKILREKIKVMPDSLIQAQDERLKKEEMKNKPFGTYIIFPNFLGGYSILLKLNNECIYGVGYISRNNAEEALNRLIEDANKHIARYIPDEKKYMEKEKLHSAFNVT